MQGEPWPCVCSARMAVAALRLTLLSFCAVFSLSSTVSLCQAISLAMFPPSLDAEVSEETGQHICDVFGYLAGGSASGQHSTAPSG